MPTEIKIRREEGSRRFWVYIMKNDKPDSLRAFLFNDDEAAAYALAEVFAEGIAQGFRLTSDLLPKSVEYLNR